jgi:hypothetical protein
MRLTGLDSKKTNYKYRIYAFLIDLKALNTLKMIHSPFIVVT